LIRTLWVDVGMLKVVSASDDRALSIGVPQGRAKVLSVLWAATRRRSGRHRQRRLGE